MLSKNRSCLGMEASIFYPEDYSGRQAALTICAECPDRLKCLTIAINNGEEEGIWGGATPSERHYMHRYKVSPKEYLAIKCGTEAGYYKHRRLGEIHCADCKSALRLSRRAQMASGKRRVY